MNPLISLLNQVIHGDCLEIMPSGSIDLVIADPPYLVNYVPRDRRRVANDGDNAWLQPAFAEIYRLLKPNTFCVSFYGWPQIDQFMTVWKRVGFSPVSHLVCVKEYPSRTGYTRSFHEVLFLLAKGRPSKPVHPPDDVLRWRYTGNTLHPTQKPVEVIQTLIEAYSQRGDVVLDPFAGSGTTGIAARNCGRQFILIEKVWQHWKSARDRLGRSAENFSRRPNKWPSKPSARVTQPKAACITRRTAGKRVTMQPELLQPENPKPPKAKLEVLDHVIMGNGRQVSLRELGYFLQ